MSYGLHSTLWKLRMQGRYDSCGVFNLMPPFTSFLYFPVCLSYSLHLSPLENFASWWYCSSWSPENQPIISQALIRQIVISFILFIGEVKFNKRIYLCFSLICLFLWEQKAFALAGDSCWRVPASSKRVRHFFLVNFYLPSSNK